MKILFVANAEQLQVTAEFVRRTIALRSLKLIRLFRSYNRETFFRGKIEINIS